MLFLNPDTEVTEGVLSGLLQFADSHKDASAFTCRLLNSNGTLQQSCFHFPNLRMAVFGFFPVVPMDAVINGRYPPEYYDRVFGPEHVLGACLMVTRDALEKVGRWDEKFFMYFEETDLCYRLTQAGYTTLYTPEISVIHHGERSTSTEHEKMSVEFYRSQAYFYRKHYGVGRVIALKAIVVLGLAFWAARSCVSFMRRRIAWTLLQTRLSNYSRILLA